MTPRPVAPWPSASTTLVGVVGDPVAHSLSPVIHNAAFGVLGLDWASVAFEVPLGSLADAVAGAGALGLRGLSVTMPHKAEAASLADRLSPTAERLAAVNCLSFDGGVVAGENTDGEGFLESLRRGAGFDAAGACCAVVGAGGAARAVVLALGTAGAADVVVISRTEARARAAAALAGAVGRVGGPDDAAAADLVVNATPAGMAGAGEGLRPPVEPSSLPPGRLVVDLVYDPRVTPWLAEARERGAVTVGGLGMLVHQAAAQLRLWTGLEPPVGAMWAAARGQAPSEGGDDGD